MSTVFGIIRRDDNPEDPEIFVSIAKQYNGGGMSWYEGMEVLLEYLPDDTVITAVDNDSDIRTLKELKEEYQKNINK